MNSDELLRRVVAENFELKDKLNETEKHLASEEGSKMYWYQKYCELCTPCSKGSAASEAEEDLPLSPEGVNAKCRMTTA